MFIMVNKELNPHVVLVSRVDVGVDVKVSLDVVIGSTKIWYHTSLVLILRSRCQGRVTDFSTVNIDYHFIVTFLLRKYNL